MARPVSVDDVIGKADIAAVRKYLETFHDQVEWNIIQRKIWGFDCITVSAVKPPENLQPGDYWCLEDGETIYDYERVLPIISLTKEDGQLTENTKDILNGSINLAIRGDDYYFDEDSIVHNDFLYERIKIPFFSYDETAKIMWDFLMTEDDVVCTLINEDHLWEFPNPEAMADATKALKDRLVEKARLDLLSTSLDPQIRNKLRRLPNPPTGTLEGVRKDMTYFESTKEEAHRRAFEQNKPYPLRPKAL